MRESANRQLLPQEPAQASPASERPDGLGADTLRPAPHPAQGPDVVLFVDDEPGVLQAVKRLCRKQPYEVLTAPDGASGLALLETHAAAVVVSDFRMPKMNGLEFLTEVRRRHPDTARVLMTGQAELEMVASAVNQGEIFRLLFKPWDDQFLLSTLREGVELHRLRRDNKRLTEELARANRELLAANDDLEARVREKAHELMCATHYDAVTGLSNRALLLDRLEHTLRRAVRDESKVAVIAMGFDRLALVTNSLGQEAGDELTRHVAQRVVTHLRESDSIGRVSPSEFALVINDVNSCRDAGALVERLLRTFQAPFEIGSNKISVRAQAGLTLFPDDADEASDLLRNASAALHSSEPDISWRAYSNRMEQDTRARLELEAELRQAVERREFILHYQPRISTNADGISIVAAEALMRWNRPGHGLVSPGLFIPVLEETGLVLPAGRWAIEEACSALSRWDAAGLPPIRLSVNLSPRQIKDPDLAAATEEALARNGLHAGRLEVEITESVLMSDNDDPLGVLGRLDRLGIELALDDFGTGYSSLAYLTRFPLHHLKIDRSFVAPIPAESSARTLVRAIVTMAHELGLSVTAEGVESVEQGRFLREIGCDELQGFLYARPTDETTFVKLMSGPLPAPETLEAAS